MASADRSGACIDMTKHERMTMEAKADRKPFLKVKDLSAKFAEPAGTIEQVSFELMPGALTTLLGSPQSGKSEILRLISGLERPASGTIQLEETEVGDLPVSKRGVSVVFQGDMLFPHMTVRQNVAYGLKFTGKVKKRDRLEKTDGALKRVGLVGSGDVKPDALTDIQYRRALMARALANEPKLLLLEEPLADLKTPSRRQFREDIRRVGSELDLTVLCAITDPEQALALSDHMIVLDKGAVMQAGTPRALYDMPNNRLVAEYVSHSNIFDCEITNISKGEAYIRMSDMELILPDRGLAAGPARLAVKPNRIILAPVGVPGALSGNLMSVTYAGNHMEYAIETAQGDIFAVSADINAPYRTGETVSITFGVSGTVLLPE